MLLNGELSYMELNEVILSRRSIRKFKAGSISKEIIEKIIEAGIQAPSASNRQLCEFVVVDDKKIKERIYKEAGAQKVILNAPVLIITLYDTRFNTDHYANIQSASAAVENMLLKIHELGMGGCWISAFGDEKILCRILNLPSHLKPLSIIIFGEPAEKPFPPSRKKVEDAIHFNVYHSGGESFPLATRPRECSWNQIKKHQQFLSRSSHLGKDYEIYADREIKKISEVIRENMTGTDMTVLSLFGYDGTLLRELGPALAGQKLIDVELSKEACDFVKYKVSSPHFLVGSGQIPLPPNSVEIILCLFSLEKLPAFEELLKESSRLLKEGGKIIIFLKNKFSFYGLMYYFLKMLGIKYIEGFFLSSGPFEPLFPARLKKVMRNLKLSVSTRGFYLLPPELETYRERVDGYLKRHGKKLSTFKFFVKPCLGLFTLVLRLTSRVTLPFICSSVCLIGEKQREEGLS